MSGTIMLFCWVINTPIDQIFPVEVGHDVVWGNVKKAIKVEKQVDFKDIDADTLKLWKVTIGRSELSFLESEDFLKSVMATSPLDPIGPLSTDLNHPVPDDHINIIIVRRPTPTITASRSSKSNLAAYIALKRPHPDSPEDLDTTKRARLDDDAWLPELHAKIWGRDDRFQELFHTVEITAAHYDELQERLGILHPDRRTGGYFAWADSAGVLSTKLEVLRNFKPPLVAPAPELAAHADNEQVKNNEEEEEEEENDDNNDPRSLFPVTIRYLDLSRLELEKTTIRMPLAFLIRNEYTKLSDLLENVDSVIISGQPGTGKTAYLYIQMVCSMIDGSPFLYQTLRGMVYHISDTITPITSLPPGSKFVAYVDADEKKFEPQSFLRHPSVKIIAASSPRGTEQPWMKQMGNAGFPITFASALWTDSELFMTGLFLHPQDLTYARLKQATTYFGFNPRLCFNASISTVQLRQLQSRIEAVVESVALKRDIGYLIVSFKNSIMLSHTIFELSPRDDDRLFGDAKIGTVSTWALDLLLGAYEAQKSDAAFKFYESIADMPTAVCISL